MSHRKPRLTTSIVDRVLALAAKRTEGDVLAPETVIERLANDKNLFVRGAPPTTGLGRHG